MVAKGELTVLDHGALAVGAGTRLFNTGVLAATCGTELDHGVFAVGHGKYADQSSFQL